MSKLKIVGNSEGLGTFTIISPNSDSNATIELPHSSGTLVTNSQDLIPTQDEVYDLGSSSKAFKDLHISSDTIFLGTQPIRATSSGIVVPEIQIGEGTSAVKLKASDDGKLKQVSTDSAGADLPEVDIPQELIDLTDVIDTAPTQGQTLIWNNTTSKFEFSIVPEVFSDFTDVDTTTTPPTDTQVLTWNNANNEWSAGNNGFPLTVANTTELLALTGMLVGQEAFVTDLNRSYTYTGSTPNDKWRHAVSGWYATDNVMTNHPMTEITGIDSAYSLSSTGSLVTITAAADDPDQKPISWVIDTIQNGADVNFNQTDNVLVISQLPSEGSPTSPIDITATFKAYDDSLDPIFFTTTISAFRIFSRVGWEDGTMIFEKGDSLGPDYLGHGKSIDLSSDGSTLIVSDAYYNKALIYDKTVDDTWVKTPGQEGTQFPTFASALHIYQPMGITEEFPNGQYDAMGMSYLNGNGPAELFHPGGIYGASIQTRFGYAGRTVALSADGLTAAVACTGETIGADIWEPNGSEELPYVDIFNRDPITRIWTRVAHKLSPSAYESTAMPWSGNFNINTDLNKPPSTWHSGTRSESIGPIATVDTFGPIPVGEVKGTSSGGNFGGNVTDPNRTAGIYTGVTVTTSGTGTIPPITITVNASGSIEFQDASGNWTDGVGFGTGHRVGDRFTIADAELGGGGAVDASVVVAVTDRTVAGTYTGVTGTSSGTGTVGTFDIVVNADGITTSVTPVNGGSGHAVGDIITISKDVFSPNIYGFSHGGDDFTMRVAAVDQAGGVIVPPAGMTIALSKGGTTLVVGYRLEGPKLTPHNQYADKSEIQLSVDQMAEWGPASAPFISIYRDLPYLNHSTGGWVASGGHQTSSGSTLNQDSPIMRPAGVYSNLTGTSTGGIASNIRPDGGSSGNGTGGVYTVTIVAGNSLGIDHTYATVEVVEFGTGHEVGDVITISDSKVGGSGNRDIQMIVESVNGDIINVPNSTPDINLYNYGAVYIYEKDSNNNWSLDEKLYGNYEAGSFGAAVDIAGEIDDGVDTRRIIVSTPNYNGGLVQVLEKTGHNGTDDVWRYVTNILPPDYHNNAVNKTNNRFGFNSISISKDGTKIAVGDPGQSVTNVIETTTSYGAGSTKKNQGGIVSSTNEFTSNFTYPAGVVYMYEKTGTSNQWFQADYASDTWALQTNGIVENFIGVSGDGFGDRVDLNFDGSILAVGAPYEHNGFYFPGAYVGAKYINEYTAKRVFYGWHRFSHGGGSPNSRPDRPQPSYPDELDTWNYTEATGAINCTVNSTSYVGFVTPADGKVDAFDLSVSFTSIGSDDDVVAIVLAFNVDSNGREHTISLIRSGNNGYPSQYVYAIVYNFAMPDESTIFDGNSLIPTHHSSWANPSTGTQTFIRNRIVRSGDSFTVTTSQAIDISNHTGTNSDLDSSTTHTFSLGSYSFGNLFSAANGGARWGFSCMSQNDSSWVNVELADAINPEEISDTGALHIYQKNLLDSWDKTNRFYPSVTTHTCIPDPSGFLGMDCSSSNPVQKLTDCHFGRLALSDDAKVLVSGYKKNASGKSHHTGSDLGRFEIFTAPFSEKPPSPITLAAPYTGFTTLGTPLTASGHALPNNGINYALPHSTVITATSTDPEGGDITWHGGISSGATDHVNGGYFTGGTTITMVDNGDGSAQITFLTPAYAPQHTFTWTIYAADTSGQTTNSTITYEWKYPVVSSNSMVFYESEPGGENYTNIPNTHTNVTGTNYNWTCPPDVYYVHALCIGGGACNTGSGIGGGGGGLGWKNNIPVVPGQTYPLKVGRGGHGNSNAHSYFISQSTVMGRGGNGQSGGTYIGDGGGNGGAGSVNTDSFTTGGCGGGAGGYNGNGGDSSPSAVGVNFPTGVNGSSGTGGGGGGGAHNYGNYATGGGGVGINGQGGSGSGGVWASSTLGSGMTAAGRGGSSGQHGESNLGAGSGGDFGGGGSGRNPGSSGDAGGGDGVVKLIWGTGDFGNPTADNAPQWPSTNIPLTQPMFQTDAQKGI